MEYYNHQIYKEEIKRISEKEYFVKILKDSTILITGARGMIGSMFIDAIMLANKQNDLNCTIYAVARSEKASERFCQYETDKCFNLIYADINKDSIEIDGNIDYVIHAASNTHPLQYSQKPIETLITNVVGTNNMLEFAVNHSCKRFVFCSSVEVYGENKNDIGPFKEDDVGYINCNTLRANYPEGKRAGEALCQAYIQEKGLDVVVPRLARCYGAGLHTDDSKALTQFLKNGLNKEDIVLKSKGTQYFSYCYQADAVDGIVSVLANGEKGEAYNISGKDSDIHLRDLAQLIADAFGVKVIFDLPKEDEAAGFSKANDARLDVEKIRKLGWKAEYTIADGVRRIAEIMGESFID